MGNLDKDFNVNCAQMRHDKFIEEEIKAREALRKKYPYAFIDRAPFNAGDIHIYNCGFNSRRKMRTRRLCLILKDSTSLEDGVVICPLVLKSALKRKQGISLGIIKEISPDEELYALIHEIRQISKSCFRLRGDLLLCENEPITSIHSKEYFEVIAAYKHFTANIIYGVLPWIPTFTYHGES